jgi:hypothetical protein
LTRPEGWTRIEADPAQAELLEFLHPARAMVATDRLVIAATEGVTGVTFAEPGEELEVRSIGNAVARVENLARAGESVLIPVSELAGKVEQLELGNGPA